MTVTILIRITNIIVCKYVYYNVYTVYVLQDITYIYIYIYIYIFNDKHEISAYSHCALYGKLSMHAQVKYITLPVNWYITSILICICHVCSRCLLVCLFKIFYGDLSCTCTFSKLPVINSNVCFMLINKECIWIYVKHWFAVLD